MSIECKFNGFCAADADSRISKAGKPWVSVRMGCGKDGAVQWLSVAVFGKAADAAAELKKGDRCLVEGTIKLDAWRGKDGIERHGLSVACFKIEKTTETSRNYQQPKRERPQKPESAASGRERAARSDYAPQGGVAAVALGMQIAGDIHGLTLKKTPGVVYGPGKPSPAVNSTFHLPTRRRVHPLAALAGGHLAWNGARLASGSHRAAFPDRPLSPRAAPRLAFTATETALVRRRNPRNRQPFSIRPRCRG
jgi:single-stranded DNA-binding protein